MRHGLTFCSCFLFLLLAPACGDASGSGASSTSSGTGAHGPADTGSVVIGVVSDLRLDVDVDRIHVVMRVGGAVIKDEVITTTSTPPLKLPTELTFDALPGGAAIDVSIDAFRPGDSVNPLVNHTAATEIVAGQKLLLIVALDSRCVAGPGSSAPTCVTPQTCVAGQCVAEHVDPSTLKPYSPTWSNASNDPCKPTNGGAPIVMVGEGQADYLPVADGATAQVEAGPQGGHHVWVALRAKNLRQSGSITSVTGHFPDLGVDVGPFNVIFTMDIDEGGYCKLYGLRFQLDQQKDINTLLGHPLDISVTVTDPDQAVGVGKKSVVLSKTFTQ